MQSGSGRNPAAPPHPPPRLAAASSPASSSPPASAPSHLGLESRMQQQHQQQQAYRQALQQQEHQQVQQQSRKADREHALLTHQSGNTHGIMGGNSFPSLQGATNLSQLPRKFGDLHHQPGAPQLCEENPNKGQHTEQHLQNPIHQGYLQYALQGSQHKPQGNLLMHQQGKMNMAGPSGSQGMLMNNYKMQELLSLQAANQSRAIFNRTGEHFAPAEKQLEQGLISTDQRYDPKPSPTAAGQLGSTNMVRPAQLRHSQASMENIANNQFTVAQMQAMQAWAKEHNVDLSVPANINLIAQVLPHLQSNRMAAMQKQSETGATMQQSCLSLSKQSTISSSVENENSAYVNCVSDYSGQVGPSKCRQPLPSDVISSGGDNTAVNPNDLLIQQQAHAHSRENENEKAVRPPSATTNGGQVMHLPKAPGNVTPTMEQSYAKNAFAGNNMQQMQQFRSLQQLNRPISQPAVPPNNAMGTQIPSQSGSVQVPNQCLGFTKQQLYVLKAQILAFRRLKRGERTLPPEVLQAIAGLPVDPQPQQSFVQSTGAIQDKATMNSTTEHTCAETNDQGLQPASLSKGHSLPKEEPGAREEKAAMVSQVQVIGGSTKESVQIGSVAKLEENRSTVIPEQEIGRGNQNMSIKGDNHADKGKAIPVDDATANAGQMNKPASNTTPSPKVGVTRNYHGPIFDFSSFTRKHDSLGTAAVNYSNNMSLAYDVKDLLLEEGKVILSKKRTENLRKISGLLAVNLERKRIRPDLVIRLQIEEKKLRLLDLQARLRDEVDQQQQEIMTMSDRPYRKFIRQCERQRVELSRQVQQMQKASREKQLKSIFQWRKKLLETHWAIRDARTTRNRGVAKYHEKMLREFSKRKDDDRNKRMEALKNNDVDRYREMLLEQQSNVPGDAAQRYEVLSSFLSQTEEYLYRLGGKITAAKSHQEVQEAAHAASAAARAQGLSEEEVRAAAACAGEEVMIRHRFSEMNAPKDSSSAKKYYNLAHAVTERVVRQPSMLRHGTLRDYQLVGLQWMLSLYNNKLNGILADEMGLGKTVQVMSLIAYLMEFKGNYGPHLIIVPNAVLVNWKSELLNWLPSISCIFYVGGKDERARLFSQEVCAVKFNVLVTTYEFVMYDRSKLSKIDWKYIIIDEAQRMKDRESVLARDLDRYRCQRRLLLTGTPLQNDLKELWSLLNVLLPEIFDNRKAFHDWFSKPFQKDGPPHNPEDDWLETEKKVIIIHRLHQILEPFMLRRRVEDVEGSLPPKVSIVLRCRMSAFQGAIYDWIRSTGTLRVDPEDEMLRVQKNPMYQVKVYKNLNNRCMELRKVCNHPLLNYPYFNDYSRDFIVRSCGKLWILDRILIKLQKAGHRVLLFSTMTKLLDILEEYLQWRHLVYRRIDGTTILEDRESAIVDFNSPDSDCFIFLLSIRAAGRGLNLQTADTVVIYDPDPNPQNELQAVARAHRIGQKREVKVIYLEAVVDKVSSYQKEDEMRNGGAGDSEDDLAGKDRYMGSIESLMRNNIQQYKIEMADEVINAGRFDQRTTHEERRLTLETLLHDEERYQETVHDVPSLQEVNRMIARSEEEVELFDQMDEELDWTGDMVKYNEVPKWLRASSSELDSVVASLSKRPSKNILSSTIELESNGMLSGSSPNKTERRRGRPKGPSTAKKYHIYRESDDEENDNSDVDTDERNPYEEEGDMGEFEDEEFYDAGDVLPSNKDQAQEGLVCDSGGDEFSLAVEGSRNVHQFDEAGSTGSSSGSRRLLQPVTPCTPSQKFGLISALDDRPGPSSKSMPDELEEGEIAASGDSLMDLHQSDSLVHDHDDLEDEQVVQPKIKRKRSIRLRPRYSAERTEDKSSSHRAPFQRGSWPHLQVNHEKLTQFRDEEFETLEAGSGRQDRSSLPTKQRHNLPSRVISPPVVQKSGRLSVSTEDGYEHSIESWSSKAISSGRPSFVVTRMSDSTQRKCKNVITKLQRRIEKDGNQLVPFLSDWWRRNENSSFISPGATSSNVLDLQRIEQRVDSSEYNGVMDFIADLQLMLKNIERHCNYSCEVKYEAGKLHDLFFDIMKIAFPDTDFREVRNAVTFSSPSGAATPSPRLASASETKRQAPTNKTETGSGPSKALAGGTPVHDEGRTRSHASKPYKESRSTGGSVRQAVLESSQLLAHPGDLVICKKKRKDRDKSAVKQVSGPTSPPSNPGRVGPLTPTNLLPASSTVRNSRAPVQSDSATHPAQQAKPPSGWAHHEKQQQQQPDGRSGASPIIRDVQWAKPVKRMRTDTGKRRPSHM